MRRMLGALLLAAVVAAGCGDDGPAGDQARLRIDGSATVTGPDGRAETVTDDTTVGFDDTVAIEDGTGSLEFADGSTYELRGPGESDERSGSHVRIGAPPELLAGELLVVDGYPATVIVDTTTLSASGVLRVDADEERATAYTGRTMLSGLGDLAELRALRSVLLSAAAAPEPLEYDGSDAWDRRYVGDAVAFGRRLEALARGYTSELRSGVTVRFLEAVLPALDEEREFNADLLDERRPPGETLVGAAIAVEGNDGNFRDRWDAIFEFRDAGAVWGLVALDQGVSSAPVLETIELAIGRTAGGDLPTSTTTTTSTTTSTTSGTDPTTTVTTTTTTTTAPPDEDDGVLDPLLEPGGDAVQDLLESLGL